MLKTILRRDKFNYKKIGSVLFLCARYKYNVYLIPIKHLIK